MALQIRRGTDTQRQALSGVNTPIAGELLYTTDNKKLHIGDGTTTGGTSIGYFGSVAVSGQSTIKSTGVNETLTVVAGANISLTTDANTGTLTITAAPQTLTNGSLNFFQNNITSLNSNEDINIDPAGTGKVNVVGNLTATTLTGALTGNVTGNVSGTAGSVTNGVYTTDTGTVTNTMLAGSIANAKLLNSSLTIGSTAISLGATSSSISGLTSLTSTTLNSTNLNVTGTLSNQRIQIIESSITGLVSNENINITASGSGNVVVNGDLTITSDGNLEKTGTLYLIPTSGVTIGDATVDGNLYMVRNTANSGRFQGLTFAQHHEIADVTNLTFYRTRGTSAAPTPVVDGDRLGDITFLGSTSATTGATASPPNGAVISAFVEGSILNTTNIPTKLRFATNNGTAFASRAELSAAGIWKVDSIAGLNTTLNITGNLTGSTVSVSGLRLFQNNITGLNSNEDIVIAPSGTGGVRVGGLRLFQNNLTGVNSNEDIVIDPSGTGKLQVLGDLNITGALKLAVYADATARNTAITSPTAGMIVFNTTGTKFQGYTGAAWVDLN